MSKTWVIVAESSRARWFSVESRHTPFVEMEDMLNPSSKVHEAELTADLPGRTVGSEGGRHALEAEASPKEIATDVFAKEIADKIEHARSKGEVENILLACPPKFLGLLRSHLTGQAEKLVSISIDKNLVEMDEPEIRGHFF